MNKSQNRPPSGVGLEPPFSVLVQRGARPPLPWTWEIRKPGDSSAYQRAVKGYRSAEEAWEAGRAALARLGQRDDVIS